MKILYDGIIYNTQPTGGINRYFANLIDGLPADITPSLTTYEIPAVTWPQSSNLKIHQYKKFRPRRISNKMEQLYFDRVANPKNYDVFHPTNYAPLVARDWNSYSCPIVVTVYDMIHHLFADEMDPTGKFAQEQRQAVEAAQAVLCISEHTKSDIIKYCNVPESKIIVTYLAAELNADLSHGDEVVPKRPYFLYLGTRTSYKNFIGLLEALSLVVKTNADFALCVVGSPFTDEERKTIEDYGLNNNIEHVGYADDPYLAKLYRCSLAFVYPSLYEGFGIPPLEAMQCGTVVVAAKVSSVPEVVGDGGILFDPRARGELADILLGLLDGSTAREPIIARGHERAKLFSWGENRRANCRGLPRARALKSSSAAPFMAQLASHDLDAMPNGQAWPRISVVTPSFNQGQFIEETITSVIGQNYPNLEFIVMDGGSSDQTVEIIKRYERHIAHWQSEKDGGQAAAINAGFARSSGEVLAWLNSDDFYLPGALHFIAAQMDASKAQIAIGNCFHFFEDEARAHGSDVVKHHARSDLKLWDYIVQPSSFWTRKAWQQTGKLNEDLNFAFDWEWFIRCQQAGVEIEACQRYLSAYRFHGAHKTSTGGEKRYSEIAEIYKRYSGEEYEQLFQALRQSARGISRVKRLGRLARVPAIEVALLKRAFPAIYGKFSAQEIEDVSSMCY